jgi:hypothetical protein
VAGSQLLDEDPEVAVGGRLHLFLLVEREVKTAVAGRVRPAELGVVDRLAHRREVVGNRRRREPVVDELLEPGLDVAVVQALEVDLAQGAELGARLGALLALGGRARRALCHPAIESLGQLLRRPRLKPAQVRHAHRGDLAGNPARPRVGLSAGAEGARRARPALAAAQPKTDLPAHVAAGDRATHDVDGWAHATLRIRSPGR